MSLIIDHRIGLSKCLGAVIMGLLIVSGRFWSIHYPLIGQGLSVLGWALSGIGAFGRIWCAVYIAGYKDDSLVTDGPYSMCRNPLYFFSMTGALGVGLATETLLVPGLILMFFVLYYPVVIKREETRLARQHCFKYSCYLETVPAFFPRFSMLREPVNYAVNPVVLKRHLMDAIWFIWLCGLMSFITWLQAAGLLPRWLLLF